MTQPNYVRSDASACTASRGVCVFVLLTILGCAKAEPTPIPATTNDLPQRNGAATKSAEKTEVAAESTESAFDWSKHDPQTIFEIAESGANFEIVGSSSSADLPNTVTFEAEPSTHSEATTFVTSASSRGSNDSSATSTINRARRVEFKLPSGFVADSTTELLNGLPTRIRCTVDGSELVLIPEGPFTLGSNSGLDNARPATPMLADSFYIGATEVRVGQYLDARKRVAAKGTVLGEALNAASPSDHPVLGIQWIDAKNYAASVGCDLPSEAQWEKAARGPSGFAAPWGNSRPLWTEPRTIEQIDPVGRHAEDRSPFGIFDMAGNALEWTADLYQEDAFKLLGQIPLDRRRNWTGPKSSSTSSQRVVKGAFEDWTVFARRGVRMTDKHPQVGFRLVLNLGGK